MPIISEYMLQNHRDCDELFVQVEATAGNGDWDAAARHFADFNELVERHLSMEEEVLFPAFEAETGNTEGPTVVMRMEHEQMRGLLTVLKACLDSQDQEQFLGLTETLMMLTQQHNMKEEQMLYPMADRALSDSASVLADMQAAGKT